MRLLIQRVSQAQVTVNKKVCGQIGPGLLLFLGIHKDDTPSHTDYLINKLLGLRIFPDDNGKMHHNIQDTNGEILVVSQFTLYGNLTNGRRPEFTDAALPEPAFLLYEQFLSELTTALGKPIASGVFGALMDVSLTNAGPATFLLEK